MVRKILIYGDLDLNIIDGSSIWLVNLAKLLLTDRKNYVDILLKKRIRDRILVNEIEKRYRIRLLYVKDYIDNITETDAGNIVKALTTLDELRDYSCMIIRGTQVMERVASSEVVRKTIPYLTDFCHEKEKMPAAQKHFLKDLYQKVQAYFVQTEAMKEYLRDVLEVDGEKFHVLYPVVFPGKEAKKQPKTIVYAGKIAKDWNILGLIDIMRKLKKEDPKIHLHFIGSKVNLDLAERKQEIFDALKDMDNITFYGSLPHSETEKITKTCSLGYSFRSPSVDNDNSLEVSVKLLEYCYNGVPVVLRRTKMHETILGDDYPLFAETKEECTEKILMAFRDTEVWEMARECLRRSMDRFCTENIYGSVSKPLQNYPMKKMRLLVSGHDLKFLKQLFPYFESAFSLEVQELREYMEFSEREAGECLKRADIVWCEWLLTAAQWYSWHIYPHQRLFIRAHRFEVMRRYGNYIDINRISKVITVSYYWFEEFMRQFGIPVEKCTVINNFIDTDKYVKDKDPQSRFHLALIGAVPKRKGLARAVELLRMLKKKDDRYCLHVPGKRPEEFPNAWNVPEERKYFERVYRTIEENHLQSSVIFDGWVDMPGFLQGVGYVLSLSDAKVPESFHVTPAEGMASGAAAAALRWEGIEYIYPDEIVMDSLEEIAEYIDRLTNDPEEYSRISASGREFVRNNYDIALIWDQIKRLLEMGEDYEEFCDQAREKQSGSVPGRQESVPYVPACETNRIPQS